MSSIKSNIRVVRTIRKYFTVWAENRPVATYWDEGGLALAERAKAAVESGVAVPGLGAGVLLAKQLAEHEAAHWDGAWHDRDPSIPLVDRLLEAAADAGDVGEPESMFQLLSIARGVLRVEGEA